MSTLQEIAIDLAAEHTANAATENDKNNGRSSAPSSPLHRLTIGRKITLFFGINLTFALFAGLGVVMAFIQISNQAQMTADANRAAFIAERLVVELTEATRQSESMVSNADGVRSGAAVRELDGALASIDELGSLAGVSPEVYSQQLTAIAAAIVGFRSQLSETPTASSQNSESSLPSRNSQLGEEAVATARALSKALEQEATKATAASSSLITTILGLWIGAASILVLLTLIAQRYFDRHVGASLSGLAKQMSRLSAGEQISDIETSNRQDEIGEMTRAMMIFHRAGMRLERLSRERAQKAQEELEEQALLQAEREEARREKERALNQIADNFERKVRDVVSQVASASSQLQSTAASMAESAARASARTGEVTLSMHEADAGATAAAAASDEFAMSISEVSQQAAYSAELARKASISTDEADATISKLAQSAEQVGHIVELIQTIAQRTNLLALNASIEAARGGETGRGFAVVASEVKELAMQTSRATEEVALQIRVMQETTGASVSTLRSIADEVSDLEGVAVSIAGAVDQQSYAGQDLARSIDAAASGTKQVSEHIEEVQELSTSTGAAASQVLSSATSLEQQAATLQVQVNAFLDEVRAA